MGQRPVSRCARARGFTLVELLVVIAIIGVLVALLLPAVQAAREAARRMQCTNNLKQITLALHNYHDSHKAFPPGAVHGNEMGWSVSLLPFLEQQALYDQFNQKVVYYNAPNKDLALVRINAYLCPSSSKIRSDDPDADKLSGTSPYTMHYYGVMGPKGTNAFSKASYTVKTGGSHGGFSQDGLFTINESRDFGDLRDGASNTLAFGEISWIERKGKPTRYRAWIRGGRVDDWMATSKNLATPINADQTALFNDMSFGSNHAGGSHFSRADGSVHFVSDNVDYALLLATASRSGGEPKVLD